MFKHLSQNKARMCLERGREELPPRIHDALARLIDQLDESHRIALDVVLDELAGDEVDESARLSRLRHIRKDIVKAFYEIRVDFSLQISSNKQSPAERLAWFAGDDLLARSLKERTEQIMINNDTVYETRSHELINANSSAPTSIVISYVGNDDQSKVNEFVNDIRTSLEAGNRGDLAESLWCSSGRTENHSRTEELRMLDQAKLVIVLWSTKLHSDPWFSEKACPRITPDKLKTHRHDCIGVIFGTCTLTDDQINAHLGLVLLC